MSTSTYLSLNQRLSNSGQPRNFKPRDLVHAEMLHRVEIRGTISNKSATDGIECEAVRITGKCIKPFADPCPHFFAAEYPATRGIIPYRYLIIPVFVNLN